MLHTLTAWVARLSRRGAIAVAAVLMIATGVLGVAASADPAVATPVLTGTPANPSTAGTATFAFTDSTSGATFQCSLDSAAYIACASGVNYGGLKLGGHTFNVRAVKSNKTSSEAAYAWSIGVTAPTISAA